MQEYKRCGSVPGLGRFPGGRVWQPTAILLPGEFQDEGAWRWAIVHKGCKQLDTTEILACNCWVLSDSMLSALKISNKYSYTHGLECIC